MKEEQTSIAVPPAKTTTPAARPNIVTAQIMGFTPVGKGVRLATSPDIKVWVNNRKDYDRYEELRGTEAKFARRSIRRTNGSVDVVYDIVLDSLPEDYLEEAFAQFDSEEGEEHKPF